MNPLVNQAMKLHLTQTEDKNLITAFSDDAIKIHHQEYHHSLIVSPNTILIEPTLSDLASLNEGIFKKILEHQPELVLLGTGKQHRFLHPRNHALLTEKSIPLECMSTAAACRTYNILMSEDRSVMAILLLG